METNKIASFSVFGLFGTHDVHIPFKDDVMILVGENGLGKTQILNMFYYVISGEIHQLVNYSFTDLSITFTDGEEIQFNKRVLEAIFLSHHRTMDLIKEVGLSNFIVFKHKLVSGQSFSLLSDPIFKRFNKLDSFSFSTNEVIKMLTESFENEINEVETIKDQFNYIKLQFGKYQVLHLPTYRRIETNLLKAGINKNDLNIDKNALINFGMSDIQQKFTDIENKIASLMKEGFSKISGDILSQLFNESNRDQQNLEGIEEDDVEIVLARVGDQLSEKEKDNIRATLKNKGKANPTQSFFLKKLIDIYRDQKPFDKMIKDYIKICNKYLINKQFVYEESNVCIFIQSYFGSDIDLENLSSGEKQLISILSRLYLADAEERFMLIFDEPELSLSMKWQKTLLPDIMNSGKCNFLLAATHSPFIFDNELDQYAIGLSEYIKPSDKVTA